MSPLPTMEELFGPLRAIPPEQLQDDEVVYRQLLSPGSPFEVERRLVHGRMQTVYKTLPASLRDFWALSSRAFGKRTMLVFEDRHISFEEMWHASVICARWLQRSFNVRKGDRVGICARNYPDFIVAFWATTLLGAVSTVLNSFHDGQTLAFSIQDVGCRVVLCDGERYERIRPSLPELRKAGDEFVGIVVMPWIGERFIAPSQSDQKPWLANQNDEKERGLVYDWQALEQKEEREAQGEQRPLRAPNVDIHPDDNGVILFTSGTTGKPKGVLSTQRQFLSSLRLATFGTARSLLRRRRALPPPPDPSSPEQSSVLLLVPLAHTTGLQSGMLLAVASGTKLVMMPTYNRDRAVQVAQREEVRGILGIGFMVREIILKGDRLPSLQQIAHGGSASAKELPQESFDHHPQAVISSGYGLTEVNGVAAHIMADDYHARPASAGKAAVGVELLIVDPSTGVALPNEQVGELWIRTPGRAQGYWNRPKDTAEAFLQDGWFRSGDLAKMDKDGFLFIVDRVKDIIVRGGENISCTHVESSIYGHEAIGDCAAIGVPDKRLMERVGVVCVVKENVSQMPSEKEIIEFAAKSLPKYAVPEFVWVRKEPLPRNPNGKILRNKIKEQALSSSSKDNQRAKL